MNEGNGYLLFVWSPAGYTLREMEGDLPEIGHRWDEDGLTLQINKIGVSPFPGDTRPCAFSVGT
jgi:hypothetical protein